MRRTVFLIAMLGCCCWLPAAVHPIGMAVAVGTFQVDHSRVQGTATLFDGSIVETQTAISELQLNGASRMRMGAASRVTVHPRSLVLDYGQLESSANYDVQANSLHITANGPDALARIQVWNRRNVKVAAVRGAVRVTNAAGVLVASVESGKTMSFEPQENAAAPTRAAGCLLSKGGKFVLAEQTANIVLEVRGPGLDKEIGNRVEINGTPEPANSQIVKVTGFRRIGSGVCAAVAKKIGASAAVGAAGATAAAGPAAAAGTATGIGIGTVAVIGGVAAAATVGSLALVGALPGQDTSNSVSR